MTIYEKIWKYGTKHELSVGYHYKKKIRSIIVPEGQVVTFYHNQDRTGKKSRKFYEGEYYDLSFYDVSKNIGVIHIESTELTKFDMITVGNNIFWSKKEKPYKKIWKIPIGDRNFPNDFPNDIIDWVEIPFGLTAELFKDGDFSGGSLIFSGNTKGKMEIINLIDYNYKDNVSSIKVRADNWVSAGISIEEENIISNDEEKVAATIELSNNSEHTATVSKEISATVEESTEENWNIEAGVTAKVGFEAGPEVAKVSGEIEVSVSGGYGESIASSKSKTFTDSVEVEVEGYGNAKATMFIEWGKLEGFAVRKWRNKRNNAIIEQKGKITMNKANRARVEVH